MRRRPGKEKGARAMMELGLEASKGVLLHFWILFWLFISCLKSIWHVGFSYMKDWYTCTCACRLIFGINVQVAVLELHKNCHPSWELAGHSSVSPGAVFTMQKVE